MIVYLLFYRILVKMRKLYLATKSKVPYMYLYPVPLLPIFVFKKNITTVCDFCEL